MNAPTAQDVEQELAAYLKQTAAERRRPLLSLGPDDHFFESGILDSLSLVDFVAFLSTATVSRSRARISHQKIWAAFASLSSTCRGGLRHSGNEPRRWSWFGRQLSPVVGPSSPRTSSADRRHHSLRYASLRDRVERLASALTEDGVESGDRIALLIGHTSDHVLAYSAALAAGAVVVPIYPNAPPAVISRLFRMSHPPLRSSNRRWLQLSRVWFAMPPIFGVCMSPARSPRAARRPSATCTRGSWRRIRWRL